MRSYKYNPDEFFKRMKKKPRLKQVVEFIDNYTVEELEQLKGNQFPKWIREELVKYKNRNKRTSEEMALFLANIMVEKSRKKLS